MCGLPTYIIPLFQLSFIAARQDNSNVHSTKSKLTLQAFGMLCYFIQSLLLAICLGNQNSHRDTVSALTTVYQRRVAVLRQNAGETKTRPRELEKAQQCTGFPDARAERSGRSQVWVDFRR